MIPFKKVLELIEDQKVPYIKVYDEKDNRLYAFTEGNNVHATVDALKALEPTLKGYNRVRITGATEAIKNANWRDAYTWNVTMIEKASEQTNAENQIMQLSGVPKGYISPEHANLLAQVQILQAKMDFEKQFKDLEKRLEDTQKEDPFMKWMPALGIFMDVDEKKMANMLKFAQLGQMMNGRTGLAGPQQEKSKLTIEGANNQEETVLKIQNEMEQLSAKIPNEKILKLLEELNKNPAYADMAINFMSMNQQNKNQNG